MVDLLIHIQFVSSATKSPGGVLVKHNKKGQKQ